MKLKHLQKASQLLMCEQKYGQQRQTIAFINPDGGAIRRPR